MSVDVVRLPHNVACLAPAVDAGVFGAAEVRLASFVLDNAPAESDSVAWALAAATWAMLHGHDCAVLPRFAAAVQREQTRRHIDEGVESSTIAWPDPVDWLRHLRTDAARSGSPVRLADGPDDVLDDRPLVVCGDRVYLQRLWIDECIVAHGILQRTRTEPLPISESVRQQLDITLPRLVPPDAPVAEQRVNEQRLAADAVLANGITVIVGGPGTGKTYSVARVLAALHRDSRDRLGRDLRVALVAPTAKAGQRLAESIRAAVDQLNDVLDAHTIAALRSLGHGTVHGLLGALGTSGRFTRNASNPLDVDIVVIDETSMMSMPLTARLMDAIRPETRVVFVGDPDQLESVELGAMLADLVAARDGALAGRVVQLTHTHRFTGDSPIAVLADALQAQDDARVRAFVMRPDQHDLVEADRSSTVRFVDTAVADSPAAVAAVRQMVEPALHRMAAAADMGDSRAALRALAEVRILCAHRRGPAGVSRWNQLAEQWMRGAQSGRGEWYAGRPVLVTRNDRRLGLSNGDTGVVVRQGAELQVVFPGSDGEPATFPPIVLADVETCFAMTVHKSQGSEYVSVALVLPPENSPLIGRELAYTGVTRARNHLLALGSADVLARCATSRAERMTGLRQALEAR